MDEMYRVVVSLAEYAQVCTSTSPERWRELSIMSDMFCELEPIWRPDSAASGASTAVATPNRAAAARTWFTVVVRRHR